MNGIENVVVATAERIFSDLADPQTIIQSRSDEWRGKLWNAVEDVGLSLAGALASPFAETLLAGWLLGHVGLEPPEACRSRQPVRTTDSPLMELGG